ncbi:hypothetical protein EAI_07955 [Harpegnathos saltator]|uniref:Uncharacterized protein n=1 Tax=Harpegnathos saltator TaxID=610380 RepID=E2BXQ4_HARSA|nr:hypothetical protein EAI_07955 [Harpegnathos saltator]
MELLSRAELSREEQDQYLKQLLGDFDEESLGPSDSGDEDWFSAQTPAPAAEASDSEESGDKENEEQQELE